MIQRTIKARFVGGPLHNQLLEVADRALVRMAVQDWPRAEQHTYHRRRLLAFESGTPFVEYWHESMMRTFEAKNRRVLTHGNLATQYHDVISITA